jgi:hypothetical protein
MPDTQVIVRVPDFVTQGCVLPETFLQWQIEARQAMLEAIASGGHPRRFAAHLPVMITFEADGPFPVRVATKGAGLTPRDEALDRYVAILEDALARCDGRSWEATITDRVTAARALLDHLEDIDRRRLGFLEIFRGGTYDNLQHDSRVVLHYTGDGPNYPSFQINGYAEILDQDDPRYRYIALARRIFEDAPFHLQQPGYVCGYLVWVHEVLDKTPHSLALGTTKGERPTLALSEAEGTNEHSSFVVRRSSARETSPAVTFREVLVPLDNSRYSAWAI